MSDGVVEVLVFLHVSDGVVDDCVDDSSTVCVCVGIARAKGVCFSSSLFVFQHNTFSLVSAMRTLGCHRTLTCGRSPCDGDGCTL